MPHTQTMPLITRRVDFTFHDVHATWLADSIKTQFMQALSLFIPSSERTVIEILRTHQIQINDANIHILITELIKQEGQHAVMHRRANQAILHRHPELKWIITLQTKFMALVQKSSSPAFRLAIPVAFEHITAAISKDVLAHKEYWLGDQVKPNSASNFLLWHCLEELEHQSICHVIYKKAYPHSLTNNARIILSLLCIWLPVTVLSIFPVQLYLLIKDKTLINPRNWLPFIGFVGRTLKLFFKGGFRYRKKRETIWPRDEITLYQAACQDFNTRQNSSDT
ncbi:MAG: metal-dependent hydrolase [Bermanella sp.]|tara:strand:- start:1405 stop:2247 length:843 start_codon:yes stop_codon:yes gene_type:complete